MGTLFVGTITGQDIVIGLQKKILKYFELSENETTSLQNLWDAAKAMSK